MRACIFIRGYPHDVIRFTHAGKAESPAAVLRGTGNTNPGGAVKPRREAPHEKKTRAGNDGAEFHFQYAP
jgi:hypothetical protein